MNITDEMLQAAVGKAIEAGLLPRNACRDNAVESKELMRLIVQAALSAEPHSAFISGVPALGRCPGAPHLSVVQDRKHAISTFAYG
ncbi:hypothetical protein [Noviherbaspirillum sp. UKPF54]|uniref:hypothetical protein n=1 Tax=Noviherbaspirillum sp. UKPF54 TaxID=2601898 RepID=UPI0011B1C19E|nr:hypothetical protein [Noviherbaspirillum sp. UKPF54]QDZ26956.1 hypothetical protein FAY22_02655 [Noviherbaspirillum sp. UKPF54]